MQFGMEKIYRKTSQQKTCTLVNFADFFKGVCKKLTCHPLFPRKDPSDFLGSPVITCKMISNQLHWSLTATVTNCQLLITEYDTLSRHVRLWNLKKTKPSKFSKLKENFIHIGCFEVQIMIENPLPAFSMTMNHPELSGWLDKAMITSPFPFLPSSPIML